MSCDETHVGRLIPIEIDCIEDKCEEICKLSNLSLECYDTWEETLNDFSSITGYMTHNSTLYKVEDESIDDDYGVDSKLEDDGSISYRMKFYNGGCDEYEIMKDILDNISKNRKHYNE